MQIWHRNTFHFLRYAYFRYAKCLFTNKATFFPHCKCEWNKLKAGIRNAKSINIFRKSIVSEKKRQLVIVYL